MLNLTIGLTPLRISPPPMKTTPLPSFFIHGATVRRSRNQRHSPLHISGWLRSFLNRRCDLILAGSKPVLPVFFFPSANDSSFEITIFSSFVSMIALSEVPHLVSKLAPFSPFHGRRRFNSPTGYLLLCFSARTPFYPSQYLLCIKSYSLFPAQLIFAI